MAESPKDKKKKKKKKKKLKQTISYPPPLMCLSQRILALRQDRWLLTDSGTKIHGGAVSIGAGYILGNEAKVGRDDLIAPPPVEPHYRTDCSIGQRSSYGHARHAGQGSMLRGVLQRSGIMAVMATDSRSLQKFSTEISSSPGT